MEEKVTSATSAIYNSKFDKPVVEFPPNFEEDIKWYRDAMIQECDEQAAMAHNNAFANLKFFASKTDKEISNEEMRTVILENVEELKKINGPLENFKKREFKVSSVMPHERKEEDWQFTDIDRYWKDCVGNDQHWRQADAIATAYAAQIFQKIGYDGIKKMFAQLDVQRDKIEEQLEATCDLKDKISILNEKFQVAAVPVDEQSQKELAKMAGADETEQEAIVSILNKLTNQQRALEELLYINHEQLCLLGKAKEYGSSEDTGKDYEEYDQKTAQGETLESLIEKREKELMEANSDPNTPIGKYMLETNAGKE